MIATVATAGLLAGCVQKPDTSIMSPRSVVTHHNPNVTSAAQIGAQAEAACQTYGRHAQVGTVNSFNNGWGVVTTETVWNCVE